MPGRGAKWGLRHRNVLCSLNTDGHLPSPFQLLTRPPGLCWRWTQGCSSTRPNRLGDRNDAQHSWLDRGDCLFSDVGNISDNQGDLAAGSPWMQGLEEVN